MSYEYQVPVTYTVSVSLSAAPSGLAGYNTNAIYLFSNETGNFSSGYRGYLSADGVKTDFGSNSLTYKMARALYTPAPNFVTGGGVLYVVPFTGTNATSGELTTTVLTTKISNFTSVTNGSMKITIDGTATELRNLNFTGVTTVEEIAQVIKDQNIDCYITVDSAKIVFTSKRFGTGSTIAISTSSTGTDISGNNYLNSTGATTTAGTNSSGQTLAEAFSAVKQMVYAGGALSTQYVEDGVLTSNAAALQAEDVVYYESIESLKDIASVGTSNKAAGNSKTRLLAYSNDKEDAKIAVATYATIAKSVNRSGVDTANTLNLKTLTGVLPDAGLNDNYVLSAAGNGVDVYGNTGGLSVVYSNDNNGFTDDIENNLALQKDIEVAGFNYLRQTNTKIPQTEQAMTGLKSVYATVVEKYIRNGAIAPGEWNGPVPFGDPESFKKNIEEKGYYIYSVPVALQPQVDREARKAPIVQIAVKSSSAIHFSNIIINVER